MAQFSRIQVYNQMQETGIIPLFYNNSSEVCYEVIKACYAGGARVFEITNRGDFAHELFGELIKLCRKNFPDLILGTGSVMDGPTAALYLQLGSNFI
ncbi:MAG TPA: hypothetical protein VI583_02940, partial [Cyclobacteriaceae bacterium]|nr:hypothetical protein [Cyclobacteriaceae bacterium]